jgi:peptidoglycan/xylan/chitin deacetylase (PgdA/CDA1 family)
VNEVLSNRLLILGWHNVEGTWCFQSGRGDGTRGMAKQFRFLRRYANVVDLADAVASLRAGRRLPPRAVAITFDDGYRDNLDLAIPMLEEYGLPATFFLVPDFLSGTLTPWWERLAWAVQNTTRTTVRFEDDDLSVTPPASGPSYARICEAVKRRTQDQRLATIDELVDALAPTGTFDTSSLMLDWDGAAAIVQRGFTVGSHSMDHCILANETGEAQCSNLSTSRKLLSERLDTDVRVLAYPNGTDLDFTECTIDASTKAGFEHAVTTIDGWNEANAAPFELRRFVVYPEYGVKGVAGPPLRHAASTVRAKF